MLTCCLLGVVWSLLGQNDEIAKIEMFNRRIDSAVVQKNMKSLQNWYADDFVFTHGTGLVEGKAGWLKTVGDTSVHYISRSHDSLTTELHRDVAIVKGKLTVRRGSGSKISAYELWYIRVFARRKRHWQLISHHTTGERHLP